MWFWVVPEVVNRKTYPSQSLKSWRKDVTDKIVRRLIDWMYAVTTTPFFSESLFEGYAIEEFLQIGHVQLYAFIGVHSSPCKSARRAHDQCSANAE